MNYNVLITKEAEEDLRGIFAYINFELLSPQSARGQIDRIRKAIEGLNELPMRYRLVDTEPWKSRGLRVRPCDNYLIFYLVNEQSKTVFISRILYGKRDVYKLL